MSTSPPIEPAFTFYLRELLAAGFVPAGDEYRRMGRFAFAKEVYRYRRGEVTVLVGDYQDREGTSTCASLVVEVGGKLADGGNFLHETAGAPLTAKDVDRLRRLVAQYT